MNARLFIAKLVGLLRVFDGIDDSTPGLDPDLHAQVRSVDGRGLLGFALDPIFAATPHICVLCSRDAPTGDSIDHGEVPATIIDNS